MRTIAIIAAASAALALTGCKATDTDGKSGIAEPPAASSSSSGSHTPAGAQAKYHGTCDTDIGSGMGNDYSLTSEVDVKNTGGVPVKAAVLVSWPQYGHAPIGTGKVITLAAGKSRTLELNKHVSMAQFSRAQYYQLKHGGELKCKYKVLVNPVS
jgi:hypothetical protein